MPPSAVGRSNALAGLAWATTLVNIRHPGILEDRARELAECIDMSPQALSRHLRVLRKAGLVSEHGIESDARVRVYSVHASAFQPVQHWMAQVEDLWHRQLHAFKTFAENPRAGRLKP